MLPIRRADVVWQGDEVPDYDALQAIAVKGGKTVSLLLKDLGREAVESRK